MNSAWSHVNTENLRFEEHLQVSSYVRPDKRPCNLINKHISTCADSATLYNVPVVINDIFMWVTCGRGMLGRRKQQNRDVCSPVSASQPASVKIITIEWWLSGCRTGPAARCLAACGWLDLNKFLLLWAKTIWRTPHITEHFTDPDPTRLPTTAYSARFITVLRLRGKNLLHCCEVLNVLVDEDLMLMLNVIYCSLSYMSV